MHEAQAGQEWHHDLACALVLMQEAPGLGQLSIQVPTTCKLLQMRPRGGAGVLSFSIGCGAPQLPACSLSGPVAKMSMLCRHHDSSAWSSQLAREGSGGQITALSERAQATKPTPNRRHRLANPRQQEPARGSCGCRSGHVVRGHRCSSLKAAAQQPGGSQQHSVQRLRQTPGQRVQSVHMSAKRAHVQTHDTCHPAGSTQQRVTCTRYVPSASSKAAYSLMAAGCTVAA